MHFVIGILAYIAVVQAGVAPFYSRYIPAATTNLVRAPQHDSAIVHSDRFGGNFAYSIAQSHAYQAFAPEASYNYHPFGYSYHQYNHLPFAPAVPAHHFYIQQPIYHTTVPSFVPVYPSEQPSQQLPPQQQPSEEPTEVLSTEEPTYPEEQTENPDAENVIVDVDNDSNNYGDREETTDENAGDDVTDDSITVDAYRFGGP